MQELMEVQSALVASEARRQRLMEANDSLSDELRVTQRKVTLG